MTGCHPNLNEAFEKNQPTRRSKSRTLKPWQRQPETFCPSASLIREKKIGLLKGGVFPMPLKYMCTALLLIPASLGFAQQNLAQQNLGQRTADKPSPDYPQYYEHHNATCQRYT